MSNPIHFVPDPHSVNMDDFTDFENYLDVFHEYRGNGNLPDMGWYFWDETWTNRFGPYVDARRCHDALQRYCKEELGD